MYRARRDVNVRSRHAKNWRVSGLPPLDGRNAERTLSERESRPRESGPRGLPPSVVAARVGTTAARGGVTTRPSPGLAAADVSPTCFTYSSTEMDFPPPPPPGPVSTALYKLLRVTTDDGSTGITSRVLLQVVILHCEAVFELPSGSVGVRYRRSAEDDSVTERGEKAIGRQEQP